MFLRTELRLTKVLVALTCSLILLCRLTSGEAVAQENYIGTETIQSPFGALNFVNGYPTAETSQRLFDQRTFERGVETFQTHIAAVSMFNLRRGSAAIGAKEPWQVLYFPRFMDSRSVWLTMDPNAIYVSTFLNLNRDGPTIVEIPPKMLGTFDDMWMRRIIEVGPTGPDRGRGRKFLIVPTGYNGKLPSGFLTAVSRTSGVWLLLKPELADTKADVADQLIRSKLRVYPLASAHNAPTTAFVDGSGVPSNTVFSDDYSFFENLAQLIQEEPVDAISPTERSYLASIGIEKGKFFNAGSHRTQILALAARVGAAMARANSYASVDLAKWIYPGRRWVSEIIGQSASFEENGYTNIDRLAYYSYLATGNAPAVFLEQAGGDLQRLVTFVDSSGAFLDGAHTYTLNVPAKIPAKYWSATVYDAETRSMLKNGMPFLAIGSHTKPRMNQDGSVDLYFGPKIEPGKEANSIRTLPSKGWFLMLRLYEPLESFYNKSWKPNDLEPIE